MSKPPPCDHDECSPTECVRNRITELERENAELVKFITECSEDRYARVACLDWLRKHKK